MLMQNFYVEIRGNDVFFSCYTHPSNDFHDAYQKALSHLAGLQQTTIEMLRIQCIREENNNQHDI